MRQISADVAVAAQCELAEGPVWDGRLRWVDILRGQVHTFDGGTHTWFEVGGTVGAVGLSRSGLVLALADRFALADDDGRNLRPLGAFTVDGSRVRFNDGKPDPWGNFWAGTMPLRGRPRCGLYRLRPDGGTAEILGGVGLSNGMDWTADRRSFYYADSATGAVDVFATDPGTGELGRRRRFVDVGGTPDGLTLDADGCVWVAVWGAPLHPGRGPRRRGRAAGRAGHLGRLRRRRPGHLVHHHRPRGLHLGAGTAAAEGRRHLRLRPRRGRLAAEPVQWVSASRLPAPGRRRGR
jgi:sugar lactone lactonase YvrE